MLKDNKGAKKNQENDKRCWAIPKEHGQHKKNLRKCEGIATKGKSKPN
jgi:hypothetical protein